LVLNADDAGKTIFIPARCAPKHRAAEGESGGTYNLTTEKRGKSWFWQAENCPLRRFADLLPTHLLYETSA
jgi:hypothetical protein